MTEAERIQEEYRRREKEIPSDYYSLEHAGNLFLYTQRIREVLSIFKKEQVFPLSDKKILEVGCGKGAWFFDFLQWGAEAQNLHGIDLDEKRAASAKSLIPSADVRSGDASHLPWGDESFDLVLQSTVFTSILSDGMKRSVAKEMLRVLKPSGIILWYDFFWDNPRNSHVKGVRAREIRELFKDCRVELKKITLAPPLSRALAKHFWIFCFLLEKFKILNTHYLGVIRKRSK